MRLEFDFQCYVQFKFFSSCYNISYNVLGGLQLQTGGFLLKRKLKTEQSSPNNYLKGFCCRMNF